MSVNSRIRARKIIGQRKAFYRHRIPESSCARKETVDIDILVTWRNGDTKIIQSIKRRYKNNSKTCCFGYFEHAWLCPPKTLVSASRKLWFLSSCRILDSCLTSFFPRFCSWKFYNKINQFQSLRYCKLLILVTLDMLGHPCQHYSITL